MTSTALLNKLDDWLNPIAVKELRQAVKSRIVTSTLMLFLLIQLTILLLFLWFGDRRSVEAVNLHAGREIFRILQGFLLGTCMLVVPAYAGVRLAAEHSDTNVDLLFISTLRPRGIIVGKMQASIVLILLIFSSCAPFMTFTYLLRGIDIPSIVLVLVIDFLVVLLATQATIFLGAIPAHPGLKLLLGVIGLAMLFALFGSTVSISIEMLREGLGSRLDTIEFWLIAGAVVIALLGIIGLLFTWTVAIVSSPSVNRALPVRLYLLGFWFVTGGVVAALSYHFRSPAPFTLWMTMLAVLLCALFLISINERERWGWRVKRTIPRRVWLRWPLFLLYSGSAGGVLFLVLLLVLTIALPHLALIYWIDPSTSPLRSLVFDLHKRNTIVVSLIALYTFDYFMLAVWLRSVLLAKWIKPAFTWVIALIVAGLGFTLPYPVLFYFDVAQHMGGIDPWFEITNPIPTIYTCIARNAKLDGFVLNCFLFLSVWGLLVLLGCLPWMIRQMKRFNPPNTEPLAD